MPFVVRIFTLNNDNYKKTRNSRNGDKKMGIYIVNNFGNLLSNQKVVMKLFFKTISFYTSRGLIIFFDTCKTHRSTAELLNV